ncbi:DUF4158 domain-containing protein [Streptomyces sp. NPDC093514]|uniref:DUF4158 domain-containing protein n=1 Tax=Streptomyces sp. NPDC093514 TaxID=3366039 RepID=UPI003809432C
MATRGSGDEELEVLRSFPTIVKDELIRCFTLTPADEASLQECRGAQRVLGAAVQLFGLPRTGGVLDDEPAAPAAAVGRLPRRDGAARSRL